jgi:hypothetical protein
METREGLAQRCQPLLEPGEHVDHALVGTAEPKWWWFLFPWLVLPFRHRVVCLTDHSVVVLKSDKKANPKGVVARHPREGATIICGVLCDFAVPGEKLSVWVSCEDLGVADPELLLTVLSGTSC